MVFPPRFFLPKPVEDSLWAGVSGTAQTYPATRNFIMGFADPSWPFGQYR
jgi:hypothetical protein